MEPNERQARFLLAAFAAAPTHGTGFDWRIIGQQAEFEPSESYDLAAQLAEAKLLRLDEEMGFLNPDGRELARRILAATPPAVQVNEMEMRFLLAAEDRAAVRASQGEFPSKELAKGVGVQGDAEYQEFRARLMDVELIACGTTLGTDRLTPRGTEAVKQIRKHLARQQEGGADGTNQ